MQEDSPLKILNISDILPNRFQPRIKFDDDRLQQLAKSIDRFGVIEPIVVRPIGSKYEVIAGERRFKASKLVSKSTIPAIVLNLTDKESEEIALLENVQRQSLSPIEEAAQYKRILDNGYISREELAKKLGKSESAILGKIRLLSLSDEVQNYLLNNKISERHARSLLNISNLDDQEKMLHRIVNERLTVKATDREIRKLLPDEDDTEILFVNERGKNEMDIDKIMREAKDINQQPDTIVPPVDLMAKDGNMPEVNNEVHNDVVSQPEVSSEPNKFVNFNMPEIVDNTLNTESSMVNNPSSNVTFDSMFNSTVSSNDGFVNESVNTASINNDSSLPFNNESVAVNATNNVNNGTIPNNENNQIQSVPSEIALEDNQSETNSLINNIENNQPEVISPLNNSEVDVPSFGGQGNNINSSVNSSSSLESQDDTIDRALDSNYLNVVNEKSDSNVLDNTNEIQKRDISTIVADAFKKFESMPEKPLNMSNEVKEEVNSNLPDTEIIDSSNTNSLLDENKDIVLSNNAGLDKNENNDGRKFANIINMLRECADKIEQNGYMLNMDEIDMDGEYKVIFTIKKD